MKLNVFYVFIFIILFHHYSFAQFKVIDSLRTVLSTAGEDTNKIRLLLLLGDEYGGINHDSSITIYEKAKKLSQKISYSKGVAISSGKIANEYVHKAEFYKAQENYEIALEINRQLKDSEDLADVYMDIGNLNSNGGLYNFPKALEAYNQSFIIWEQLGRKNKMADALSARGTLYNFIDDRQKSIEDLSKGLNIYIQLKDSNKSASNYLEIGRTYCWENKYDLAVENLNEAFRLFTLLHNEFGVNMCAFMNGVNNMNHGNFKKAIEYYEVSLNYFLKNSASFKHNLSINYDFLGRSYNRLKNYKKAIAYINEAIKFAKENNDLNAMLGAYADLTIAYEGQKEFSSALDAYKNFKLLHDSIEKINMGKEILRKEMQFDFVQKELTAKAEQNKKDALNLAEVKKQRIIRNSVSGGLAVVFLFSLVVYRQRSRISKEKKRSDELLLNILPGGVAEELKIKGFADAKQFDQVTVMFTDFKGFTQISEKLSPSELVAEIHTCFKAFDNIIGKHNIEKIKTIGDSYMCAGGLPVANKTNATDVVSAALEIREFMQQHLQQRKSENKEPFEIRIGVHTGPVVAGIVGVKKFAYDIWGDTVNIASRMESSGEAGKVNISGSTYELVKDKFNCIHRGKIMAKNKGEIDMYFVEPGINH